MHSVQFVYAPSEKMIQQRKAKELTNVTNEQIPTAESYDMGAIEKNVDKKCSLKHQNLIKRGMSYIQFGVDLSYLTTWDLLKKNCNYFLFKY